MPIKIKDGLTDESDSFDGLLAALLGSIAFVLFVSGWSFFIRGNEIDVEKIGTAIAMIAGAGGFLQCAKRLGEKYGNRSTTDSGS